eukprot:2979054-Rhodomonas_salina.2
MMTSMTRRSSLARPTSLWTSTRLWWCGSEPLTSLGEHDSSFRQDPEHQVSEELEDEGVSSTSLRQLQAQHSGEM